MAGRSLTDFDLKESSPDDDILTNFRMPIFSPLEISDGVVGEILVSKVRHQPEPIAMDAWSASLD
jgi:hypothetical protein